jgi:hypothetical protein
MADSPSAAELHTLARATSGIPALTGLIEHRTHWSTKLIRASHVDVLLHTFTPQIFLRPQLQPGVPFLLRDIVLVSEVPLSAISDDMCLRGTYTTLTSVSTFSMNSND